MEPKDTHNQSTLSESLLRRIEEEKVSPRSRMFFRSRECFIWALWLSSVVVGALAVAISVFVVTHRHYELYEATHENFLTFMVDVLPYIWVIVFGTMAFLAVYNIRHTSKGYRYSVPTILASSIVLSFAGGSALQYFGVGYSIDSLLGKQMPMYMSQEKIERQLWQAPEEGRLVGKRLGTLASSSTIVVFEDITGEKWEVEVRELFPADQILLNQNEKVRVLGKVMALNGRVFHACGVFPWTMSGETTMYDMSQQRDAFIENARELVRRAEDKIVVLEEVTFADASAQNTPSMEVCASIAAVRRVQE